jgi:hypothetical protein
MSVRVQERVGPVVRQIDVRTPSGWRPREFKAIQPGETFRLREGKNAPLTGCFRARANPTKIVTDLSVVDEAGYTVEADEVDCPADD